MLLGEVDEHRARLPEGPAVVVLERRHLSHGVLRPVLGGASLSLGGIEHHQLDGQAELRCGDGYATEPRAERMSVKLHARMVHLRAPYVAALLGGGSGCAMFACVRSFP